MTTNADNAFVAATGAVYYGETTTTLPTAVTDVLDVGLTEVGYVSEEGIVESEPMSVNPVKAWQNADVVRKLKSEHDVTYKLTLLETSAATLGLIYDGATASAYEITGAMRGRKAFVFDLIDGDKVERIVIPSGQITERGDRQLVGTNVAGWPITITAYPDTSGVKAYGYMGTVTDES